MHNRTRRMAHVAPWLAMAYLAIAGCPGFGSSGAAYASTDASFVPPVIKKEPPPIYPASAIRDQHSGTTTLMLLVGTSGQVVDIKIEKSSGYRDLDKAAIDVAHTWEYQPARRGGVAVEAYARVPVNFSPRTQHNDRGLDLDCSTLATPMMRSHTLRPDCTVEESLMGAAQSVRIHPDAAALWRRMATTMAGSREWYIDDATAMKAGKTIYFWAKQVLDVPARHEPSVLTTRIREYAFDCDTRQIASMVVWYYDGGGVPWTADGGEPPFSVPSRVANELEGLVCRS